MNPYEPYGILACVFIAVGSLIPKRPATRYCMFTGTLLLALYSWFTKSWSVFGLAILCFILSIIKFIQYRRKAPQKGAIICGYPGIGKSALGCKDPRYIDLESSNFRTADPTWYIGYCNAALDLYAQGHYVMLSCHLEVREYLLAIMVSTDKFDESRLFVCYPSMKLKNFWINRLTKRKNLTQLDKDRSAYDHACKYFNRDIESIESSDINKIVIDDEDYSLSKLFNENIK